MRELARVLGWSPMSWPVCGQLADVLAQTTDAERLRWPRDELAVRVHHGGSESVIARLRADKSVTMS